jgi:hypothetical protein
MPQDKTINGLLLYCLETFAVNIVLSWYLKSTSDDNLASNNIKFFFNYLVLSWVILKFNFFFNVQLSNVLDNSPTSTAFKYRLNCPIEKCFRRFNNVENILIIVD